jgi:hypothetical protein
MIPNAAKDRHRQRMTTVETVKGTKVTPTSLFILTRT